ncbi:PREDICTED: E3 ubiquitin-protein ligase RNF216-like [Branchiostoma belcheri]|uniref:E3 ubiquitin-protein ligase RNF216-like n=1 Tax=Branchiostoma belcheri TaxID=7741 RepID=A0A6P4XLS7_BRABE|nr:PREDICTED: E3 ubiquitin-protein ligase RNF216-like [Branchiostoma belcheri]
MIECGCCYGEVTFEDMVQCYDGHLFCVDCLKNYTKEKVFGSGQASLSCMTDGCDSTFPMGQLEKALPENMLKKYEERLEEENINLAGLDDLVRCPSCDYAILAEGDKVFRCQNPECMKSNNKKKKKKKKQQQQQSQQAVQQPPQTKAPKEEDVTGHCLKTKSAVDPVVLDSIPNAAVVKMTEGYTINPVGTTHKQPVLTDYQGYEYTRHER